MDPWLSIFFAFLAGYALGSIPFGVFLARCRGVAILSCGSGNPGATNVCRCVGRGMAWLVFALDAAKGAVSIGCPSYLAPGWPMLPAVAFTGAVLGHCFSPLLSFRGGRGVAVAVGGLAIWMPNVLLIAAITWLVLFFTTRFVSLASLGLALTLPLCSYLFGKTFWENCFITGLAIFLLLRHLPNIHRLLSGTEHRFGRKDG
ncbi:MAG: glycerol-3-phosphate 1-O-acyltransferase PlsY [Puniceicoccales bacterium]|nr:glycerol-3-phosphate 1-O-acyltransferase PlsY [Puniceicoccales bacterium]